MTHIPFRLRRISVPVYAIAISFVAILILVGWIVRENYQHNKELREQQDATTVFLRREVCARLEFRDEIFGSVLLESANKYAASDPAFSNVFLSALEALRFSTSRCLTRLPE